MRLLRLSVSRACVPLALALASCSGGGGTPSMSSANSTGSGIPVASKAAPVVPSSFKFTIPRSSAHAAVAAHRRSPQYLPATTLSLQVTLVTAGGIAPSPAPAPTIADVGASVSGCVATSGDYTCTVTVGLPIGTDVVLVKSFDAAAATGNVLSQQNGTFTVVAGSANNFTMTLDASPGAISVTSSGTACSGSPLTCTVAGTNPLALAVTVADAHGTTLANNAIPGSPIVSGASSNSGVATVTASQSPYGITVTPVSNGTASIAITANPASGTSGLSATTVTVNLTVATPAALSGPAGVALDGAGNLYVVNAGNGSVQIRNSAGAASSIAGGAITGFLSPFGIALDGAGNIYVANRSANQIKIFTSTGATSPIASGAISGLNSPYGVTVDGAGNIYVANFGANNVKIYTSSGTPSSIAGGTITGLRNPCGVAVDGAGNIYVSECGTYDIKIFTNSTTAGGVLSTTIGVGTTGTIPSSAGLSDPIDLKVDNAGNIYVANFGGNLMNVNVFSSSGALLRTITNGVQNPAGVALAAGNLYVGNIGNNTVTVYTAATGVLTNTIH